MQRESPWGPLDVADAHLHFFSHRFFSALTAQKPGLTLDHIGAQLGLTGSAVQALLAAQEFSAAAGFSGRQ